MESRALANSNELNCSLSGGFKLGEPGKSCSAPCCGPANLLSASLKSARPEGALRWPERSDIEPAHINLYGYHSNTAKHHN